MTTAKVVPESALKARVVAIARCHGWNVYSVPMVKPTRPVRSGASGYPDLTLARNCDVRWVELKSKGGKLSTDQAVWMSALPWVDVLYEDATDDEIEALLA